MIYWGFLRKISISPLLFINIKAVIMDDNIEDFCSYEVDLSLKEWISIHNRHTRYHKIVNLDGINNIYLICKDCKSILIHDSF
jgi:hypothetical protein